MAKTIPVINSQLQLGKTVSASVPRQPEHPDAHGKESGAVDVVTTATFENNLYAVPPPPVQLQHTAASPEAAEDGPPGKSAAEPIRKS
ncbi:hypothetical protein ACFL43_04180 [Thermodesulfobacteriota bacterium]